VALVTSVRFIGMGDWGTAHEGQDTSQVDVAASMAKYANRSDFVLTVGDNFYENGVKSTNDSLWKTDFESVYNQPSLQIPWWVTLGNHDYSGSISAQIDYNKKDPRWMMPSRYYSQIFQDANGVTLTLVALDTNAFVTDTDDPQQWSWLKAVLKTVKSDWLILAGHHPIVHCGGEEDNMTNFNRFASILMPILVSSQVDIYLTGHKHNLQHLQSQNINFVVSGSGGRLSTIKTKDCSFIKDYVTGFSENGYSIFDLLKTSGSIEFYGIKEKLYHVDIKPKKRMASTDLRPLRLN